MNESLESSAGYLFVYGTLRKDTGHPAHKIYLNTARFVGYAQVRGDLYMIDYYPGFIPAEQDHWVKGEVYALASTEDWQRLDVYEACSVECAQPHEYRREKIAAQLENGSIVFASTYIYILPVADFLRIPSGDFLRLPVAAH